MFESFLIVSVFNAGSFFVTTTYSRSISSLGVVLTLALSTWVLISSKAIWGYGGGELGYSQEQYRGGNG